MTVGRSSAEKLLSQIDELAHLLFEEAGEEEIFFRDRVFKEKYLSAAASFGNAEGGINAEALSHIDRLTSLYVRGMLSRRLCDLLGISGIRSVSTFYDEVEEAGGSVCYVRSPNADKAYLALSEEIDSPRAVYAEDFTQACESVYYGRSTYCILPVSSYADGRLASFRNLVIKYSLKTALVTGVGEGEDETVFALMKRELEIPREESNTYLDIRLSDASSLSDVLAVAEVCNMRAVEGAFGSAHQGSGDLTLEVSEEGICGFLTYLSLEHPDFITVGIYKKL